MYQYLVFSFKNGEIDGLLGTKTCESPLELEVESVEDDEGFTFGEELVQLPAQFFLGSQYLMMVERRRGVPLIAYFNFNEWASKKVTVKV